MRITKAQFRKSCNTSYIGIANIVIDNSLAINDIKVYPSNFENGYHIVFPCDSVTKQHGKRNIVPLTAEIWQQIKNVITTAIESN